MTAPGTEYTLGKMAPRCSSLPLTTALEGPEALAPSLTHSCTSLGPVQAPSLTPPQGGNKHLQSLP